jgi:hypothetical protein
MTALATGFDAAHPEGIITNNDVTFATFPPLTVISCA